MRTIIELPHQEARKLDHVARRLRIPRTEAVRRAVVEYNRQHADQDADLFGLWRNRHEDGVVYQRRQRKAWDR